MIKRIVKGTVIALLITGVASCAGNKTEEAADERPPEGMVKLDLTHFEKGVALPLQLYVPDETTGKGKPEVSAGLQGETQVIIGREYAIRIMPAAESVKERKEFLAREDIFKTTYLADEENAILYKKEIPDAGVVQYHFYVVKTIETPDGKKINYGIDNSDTQEFTETAIRRMFDSAKTVTPTSADAAAAGA